jgi:hypothetical protein
MFKKVRQQGRSERRAESYPLGYVEGLSDARTQLAAFFTILLSHASVDAYDLSGDIAGLFGRQK